MGEPALRVIAHELVSSIKGSVSVDWMHREAARARIRVLVKRILRKYGYPPDLQDAAVQTVLQQAERSRQSGQHDVVRPRVPYQVFANSVRISGKLYSNRRQCRLR